MTGEDLLRFLQVRGWTRARLIRELRRAGVRRGDELPGDDSLRRMIRQWVTGARGISPRYAVLLDDVFGVAPGAATLTATPPTAPPGTASTTASVVTASVVSAAPSPVPPGSAAGGGEDLGAFRALAILVPEGSLAGEAVEDTLAHVRAAIRSLIEIDNQVGGSDVAGLAATLFRSMAQKPELASLRPGPARDVMAVLGELAEVAGWLFYDAAEHAAARRLNQESLYWSRLAGDRSMELLTLQNSSMHASFLGRPAEALALADLVLDSGDRLSPRVRALFLMRRARALAQGGDDRAMRILAQVDSLHDDGVGDTDPAWAWWVDTRELHWHRAMALTDLARPREALVEFERSVEAVPAGELRSRYVHLAYLLRGQATARAWRDVDATVTRLLPLAPGIASHRAEALLSETLRLGLSAGRAGRYSREPLDRLRTALRAAGADASDVTGAA